jgi:hypothetical protein
MIHYYGLNGIKKFYDPVLTINRSFPNYAAFRFNHLRSCKASCKSVTGKLHDLFLHI